MTAEPGAAAARAVQGLLGADCILAGSALGAALHHTRGEVAFDRVTAAVIGPPSPLPHALTLVMARLADRGPATILFLALALTAAVLHRRVRPVLAVLATGAVTPGLVLVGKRLADRTVFNGGLTYPSGHVAGSTALAVAAVLVLRGQSPCARRAVGAAAVLLPVVTALGAIWTQSHVWTDVVGGALAGAGASLLVWSALVPSQRWVTPVDLPSPPTALPDEAHTKDKMPRRHATSVADAQRLQDEWSDHGP